MALNSYIAAERQKRLEALLGTPTFLVVAGALPGLAVANNLEQGFAIGAVTAVAIVAMALLVPVINGFTNWITRIPVALVVSAAVVGVCQVAVYVADPAISEALGMYLPLVATNALVMTFVAKSTFAVSPAKSTLATAVFAAVCALAALTFVGLANGILSAGEIFGLTAYEIAETPIAVFGKPAGSLLLLALVAVFTQSLEGGLFKAPEAASDGGEE